MTTTFDVGTAFLRMSTLGVATAQELDDAVADLLHIHVVHLNAHKVHSGTRRHDHDLADWSAGSDRSRKRAFGQPWIAPKVAQLTS